MGTNMTSIQTPGLLWNDRWIPPLRNAAGEVPTLKQLLLRYGQVIFPDHFVAPFDLIMSRDPQEEQAVADLAIVSKDYASWHILFVVPHRTEDKEVLRTNLETALLSPYGNREVNELKRQIEQLDEDLARAMVTDGPGFVIVTDNPRHRLDEELAGFRVDIMVVEPFQLDDGFVFRINGKNPAQPKAEVLALCDANPGFPGSLTVQWISLDEAPPEGIQDIKHSDVVSEWHFYSSGAQRVMMPENGRSPLQDDPPFELIKDSDGNYALRRKLWEG